MNLTDGNVSLVNHLSEHQIYSGAWDESNLLYAFYSRSNKEFGAQLFVYDLINNTIQEIKIPKSAGLIDPNASISWFYDQHLIISTEQASWKIELGRAGLSR